MLRKITFFLFLVCLFSLPLSYIFAEITPGQEIRSRELQEKEMELREKIEAPKKPAEVKKELPSTPLAPEGKQKAYVSKINVAGTTLISAQKIKDIIAPFQNRELTLRDLQKVADLITDAYRQKGYITSRAYLPPQKIEQGILEIRVVEGITGDIEIKGNRYFKSSLLKGKITLRKGQPFDYNTLRKGLSKINGQPDRFAHTVLAAGKELGTTDVVLEVKDRLPIHLGFAWDNYGSRYINKDRYALNLSHNNLLGFDDKLTFQYQFAQGGRYFLKSLRYLLPATPSLDVGFYTSFSRVKLGQDVEDSDSRGKTQIYGLFAAQNLVNTDNTDITFNLGFDYKDITNYQLQTVSSNDRLRIAKAGLDMNFTDSLGRTIISGELGCGIPNIMGGLREQDSKASRSGSGGKFVKETINVLRLHKMPFASSLLWKNQIQLTSDILTSAEQFQIGGISNVRGYGPAEATGDRGYASTAEWSFPFYPLPRDIKTPFSKAKLYDALKLALFYDWANARLKRPSATEEKNKTLSSGGWGLRLNLPEDFSLRLDMAWPLTRHMSSDGDHAHTWVQVSKNF